MMDYEQFRQDRSSYERPDLPYVCGRAAFFKKSCADGPSQSGGCGGTSACRPFKLASGRYECRRPKGAGGPCGDGPLPDGNCSRQHPPCEPKRSLRGVRGRLSALGFALMVALIAYFAYPHAFTGTAGPLAVDPGPLSGGHAKFTAERGCTGCHDMGGTGTASILVTAFKGHDMTGKCTDCHNFAGSPTAAHNAGASGGSVVAASFKTECVQCHTEHKGEDFDIKVMTDAQCNTCHQVKVKSFTEGHPKFSPTYPFESRNAIRFDHQAHLNKYFSSPGAEAKAPRGCVGCHEVSQAQREVRVSGGFEKNCASCHTEQIAKRELVLFTLPTLEKSNITRAQVRAACGVTAEDVAAMFEGKSAGGDSFESVSSEDLSQVTAYILGVAPDEPDTYGDPVQKLMLAMARDGKPAIQEALAAKIGAEKAEILLAGLSTELVKQAACAWAANKEHQAVEDSSAEASAYGGWRADELSIRYTPSSLHRDLQAQAWLGFAASLKDDPNLAADDQGQTLVKELLSLEGKGLGTCASCHSVSKASGKMPGAKGEVSGHVIDWKFRVKSERAQMRYRHAPHLDLLAAGKLCQTCHVFDEGATQAYSEAFKSNDPTQFKSSFQPITNDTCLQCHKEGEVKQNCQLCHQYHRQPSIRMSMM